MNKKTPRKIKKGDMKVSNFIARRDREIEKLRDRLLKVETKLAKIS